MISSGHTATEVKSMVKGISRQIIVVRDPDPKLFEQAIFILKEGAADTGITDAALLKEARRLSFVGSRKKGHLFLYGPVWACGGALLTGLAWLVSSFF